MTYDDGVRYEGGKQTNDFLYFQAFIYLKLIVMFSLEWKNNWRDGKGSLYYLDGSVFTGTFRGDEKVAGVLQLTDGIMIRERYVDGVLQR